MFALWLINCPNNRGQANDLLGGNKNLQIRALWESEKQL